MENGNEVQVRYKSRYIRRELTPTWKISLATIAIRGTPQGQADNLKQWRYQKKDDFNGNRSKQRTNSNMCSPWTRGPNIESRENQSSVVLVNWWIKPTIVPQASTPISKRQLTKIFRFSDNWRSTPTFRQNKSRGSGASLVIIKYGWPDRLHCTAAIQLCAKVVMHVCKNEREECQQAAHTTLLGGYWLESYHSSPTEEFCLLAKELLSDFTGDE